MSRKDLGQYMTPKLLANIVAREVGDCDTVVDLAVGDGALISAINEFLERPVCGIGFDIDSLAVMRAREILSNARITQADGLAAKLRLPQTPGRVAVVGNPPFIGRRTDAYDWVKKAFPDIAKKGGTDRTDVHFLARSLTIAKRHSARLVMILPAGFADGEMCRQIRASLMARYHVERSIEVSGIHFADTEARVVILVIDTAKAPAGETEIIQLDEGGEAVWRRHLTLHAGERMDARYHKARSIASSVGAQLQDLNVSVTRGLFSRKEAEDKQIFALHTTHLSQASSGALRNPVPLQDSGETRCVVANAGDILLPRTGTRVAWSAVMLEEGEAPITDHVFRIRAPESVRNIVLQSFQHPLFRSWLEGVSKGVCATVLTKKDLMEMPVFAMQAR